MVQCIVTYYYTLCIVKLYIIADILYKVMSQRQVAQRVSGTIIL